MNLIYSVIVVLICAGSVLAQSALPLTLVSNVFSSNMVLQREPLRANIWGWATAGASVNLALEGPVPATKTVTADSEGKWMIKLDPTPAGGPYVLKVSSGNQNVTFTNVLFGDVFYCSGQSNMAYGLNSILNGTEEANLASEYPHIRLFAFGNIAAPVPFVASEPNLVLNSTKTWQVPTSSALLTFSAICWLNARHLSDWQNKEVPLGLVNGAWSGKAIELFMSPAVGSNAECPADDPMTSTIFNTMVYPLYPLQFTAMYWYQGEANLNRADYGCMLSRMVLDYRTGFQNDFSFVVIQYAPRNLTGLAIPVTREQQRQGGIRAGNYCVVSNIDLGDEERPTDAHPRNKGPLGWRAHLCTRKTYYNESNIVFSGPLPKCTVADASKNMLTINFYKGTIGTGLELREASCPSFTNQPSQLCRYAWEVFNGTAWYPAEFSLTDDKQSLVLSGVTLPTNLSLIHYRNGHAGWPLSVLYNSENLPPPNYVMSYQPDCDVEEIYEPEVPPATSPSKAETPTVSTPPSSTVPLSTSNAAVRSGLFLLVVASVFVLI